MKDQTGLKKDWVVTPSAFDRLLIELDPDRERAGERYEQIRRKLAKFFEWRGCSFSAAEEYTDRTIDRVARRIEEGAEIHSNDPYLYFHGTAINVLREHWKGVEKAGIESLDDLSPSQNPSVHPDELNDAKEERVEQELRLECLSDCVNKLPTDQLEMITDYHQGEGGAKISRRKEMAKRLNLPLNALRIRMYRLRSDLEECVSGCVKQSKKV